MTVQPKDAEFGRALMLRLASLRRQGMTIGPREQFEVTALASELLACGAIQTMDDFEPYLAPAICRNTQDFDAVDSSRVRKGLTKGAPLPGPATPDAPSQSTGRRPWLRDPRVVAALGAILLAVVISLATQATDPHDPIIEDVELDSDPANEPVIPDPPTPDPQPEQQLTERQETVQRILTAWEQTQFQTLDELAANLDTTRIITDAQLAAMWSEFSGIEQGAVVDLSGEARSHPVLARLAQALDRIEKPGREGALGDYSSDFQLSTASLGQIKQVYPGWQRGTTLAQEDLANPAEPEDMPEELRARIISLITGAHLRDPNLSGAAYLNRWLRNFLAMLPVFLLVFWIAERFRRARTQVNQRAPRSSPLHTSYIADAVLRFNRWNAAQRDLARALQQRDQHEIPVIDPDASISATLAEGGQIFELRNKILRPSPEYLVLIEQRSPGDQQAQQMRALLEPFRARNITHFEVFYYQTEPSWLTPELGGRAIHIDTVRAFFRNHRLIVMGTGRGFLRSSDLSPLPSVEALKTWGRRAMLTPTRVIVKSGV